MWYHRCRRKIGKNDWRVECDKFQKRVASQGGAVLYHPYDIVQLEHMISVDCLQ